MSIPLETLLAQRDQYFMWLTEEGAEESSNSLYLPLLIEKERQITAILQQQAAASAFTSGAM
jgi:hypothetical protein